MWKKGSIGGRLISIYFLLVFIALTIVGVFIIQQLEAYHMNNTRDSLTKVAQEGVLKSLSSYSSLKESQQEIQINIETWYSAVQEEIFVVDESLNIVASTNSSFVNKSAIDDLDAELITKALTGIVSESEGVIGSQKIPVMNMAFPIENEENVTGVLYIREDLTSVYDTLEQSMLIFIQAMLIALCVTVILGVLISKGITRPINQLTHRAEAMSKGDFKRQVNVKSGDEIGRLGKAFNQMAEQLDKTMSEISDEKNKLEIVLKTMADGLIATDELGRIIHINSAALDMFNITEEYAKSKHYDALISEYCPELILEKIRIKTEAETELESAEIFEYNGYVYYARYEIIDRSQNSEVGLVVIIQDITERQKLESMQKDFVANVSHELNTPLTTIKSYTETILDSEGILQEEEMVKRFLTVIDSEADRMSRLVKDLLQLSRLESQREKWNKSVQDVVSIVSNVVLKNSINAKNKNQHLNSLFNQEQQILAYVDPDKFEQVLLNILSNAIKYTEENGRIDVDVIQRNDNVYITVMDNGIGISEKELPRLFERFYRVDKARSRSMGSGTGLGLSIAKQIIEEHEGTISIESKEGKGTTVTIQLPVDIGSLPDNIEQ
ncbi:MAG: cell wall metabolism sensor histidine kinase WalK [Clostridiales bacterium]|nr:cell wall metabolism sensor histidine kinase WalK [Clostridiales bacterium]